MLLGVRRTATIVALDNCELYSLGRGEMEDLLRVWPEMWRDFAGMAGVSERVGGAGMVGVVCAVMCRALWCTSMQVRRQSEPCLFSS